MLFQTWLFSNCPNFRKGLGLENLSECAEKENWFRRCLRMFGFFPEKRENPDYATEQSLISLQESLGEDLRKSSRLLRHVGLKTDENTKVLQQIDAQFEDFRSHVMQHFTTPFLSLSKEDTLSVLDTLDKLILSQGFQGALEQQLFEEIRLKIMKAANLQSIAHVGEVYSTECIVSASVCNLEFAEGVICNIVQQGYRDGHGKKIRDAVVVVNSSALDVTYISNRKEIL
jgi:hypothetical protein